MAQENQKRDTDETSQPQNVPIQCANKCGFFGSAATDNLCSKCYKDHVLKKSKDSTVIPVAQKMPLPLQVEPLEETVKKMESQEVSSHDEGTSTEYPVKSPTNRCSVCHKRVGLTGFKCRCDQMFCSFHRYTDKHNCSFDYKRAGQDAIAKANPVLKADKIEKI